MKVVQVNCLAVVTLHGISVCHCTAANDDCDMVYSECPAHFQRVSWESRCLSNPFTEDFQKWKTEILTTADSD